MAFWDDPWTVTILGGFGLAALLAFFPWWRRKVRLDVRPGTPRDFPMPDAVLGSVDLPFLRLELTSHTSETPAEVTLQARTYPDRLPVRLFRPDLEADGGPQLQQGTVQPLTVTFPHRGWKEQIFVSVLELQDFVGNQAGEARFTFLTIARSRQRHFRVRVNLETGECTVRRWRP